MCYRLWTTKPERVLSILRRYLFLGHSLPGIAGGAGCYGIDPDAKWFELLGQAKRQSIQSRLSSIIRN